jgi:hypothetical protein
MPMQIGHQSSLLDKGTPVARRVRKATGLLRSQPGSRGVCRHIGRSHQRARGDQRKL